MCEMEAERQNRHKHDPGEPSFPVAVGVGLRWLMENAGMTVCDVADRTGLDAKELNLEVNEGNMPLDHLADMAIACGSDPTRALDMIEGHQQTIERMRWEERKQ